MQGERTCSIAITEPGAGSDAAGIRTRAEKTGDGYVLNGNKHFISDGFWSDFFIVSAVTDPAKRPHHVSLFLVDKGLPGVTVGRNQKMMGLAGTPHVELFFENVKLGPEHLLGGEGRGLAIAYSTLGRVRLAQVGARAVGKSCRLLKLMTDYANERRQFGKAIGEFQMVQQMIADSVLEINAARLMLLRAAWEIDQGRDARDWISMVKIEAAETLGRVADRAVQVFGGMGYCARAAARAAVPRRADLPHLRRHVGDPPDGRREERAEARRAAVGHRRLSESIRMVVPFAPGGDHRPPRRADLDRRAVDRLGHAARAGGQAAGARGHDEDAQQRTPRRADGRRAGLQGFRRRGLASACSSPPRAHRRRW